MIRNKSKNKIIAKDYIKCYDLISKTFGLMFRKQIKPLIFIFKKPRIYSLHTYFVKFPIDVVFLNDCFEIVDLKKNLMPFKSYKPKKMASFVLELPEHSIINSNIKVGDIVNFK
ncbi:DUF192 domain-containing protein [Candidatus Woesearchaeota archaeon]|nr:DUF192 domain-containing protein [Candidatus Woesearchaeota archaeon]